MKRGQLNPSCLRIASHSVFAISVMAGDGSIAAVLRVGVEIVALAVSLENTTGVLQLAEECPAFHTANASAFRRTPRRRMGSWSFRTRR